MSGPRRHHARHFQRQVAQQVARHIARLLVIVTALAFLAACAGQTVTPGERAPYIQSQKEQARLLRQQGKLAQSLTFWRSILPADKSDKEVREAIASLEREINGKVKGLGKKAASSYGRGNYRQGDTHALKILALQPGHKQALAWLVASTTKKARAQASSKTRQEYSIAKPVTATVEKPTAERAPQSNELASLLAAKNYAAVIARAQSIDYKNNPEAAALVRSAHIGQGEDALKAANTAAAITSFRSAIQAKPMRNDPLIPRIRNVQQESSDKWYKQGRNVLNSDIDAAIAAFEKALEIKPDHTSAKSALKRAQTLKRNLEKIESQ
ncbi:MAG: hypothetical protein AB8C02_07910 [Halioglobus sp.]